MCACVYIYIVYTHNKCAFGCGDVVLRVPNCVGNGNRETSSQNAARAVDVWWQPLPSGRRPATGWCTQKATGPWARDARFRVQDLGFGV